MNAVICARLMEHEHLLHWNFVEFMATCVQTIYSQSLKFLRLVFHNSRGYCQGASSGTTI